MELDEAIGILINLLQRGQARNYGYDLYAHRGAEEAALRLHPNNPFDREQAMRDLSPIFYEAAWEMCRRGIVRPGIRRSADQAVEEGGYALTKSGRTALGNLDAASLLIVQPGRKVACSARKSGNVR